MKILAIASVAIFMSGGMARAASCQLSAPDCLTVMGEMQINDFATQREAQSFAGVDPDQRAMLMRETANLRNNERAVRLGPAIRNEIARLEFCKAEDARRARTGEPAQPSPQCQN